MTPTLEGVRVRLEPMTLEHLAGWKPWRLTTGSGGTCRPG